MGDQNADYAARLEYFRGEIRAQRISYEELAELQGLAEHIDPSDVELLEWAGVPEQQVGEREVTDAEYVRLQEAADRIAAALKTHSPDTPVVLRCEDYWGDEDPRTRLLGEVEKQSIFGCNRTSRSSPCLKSKGVCAPVATENQNADYVSPDEAVRICREGADDPGHPVWGLLSLEMKRDFEMLEERGLRIVRTQNDRSEDA